MLKKEDPMAVQRHKLLQKFIQMNLLSHTGMKLVECMDGKTEAEIEKLAEQLLEIITTSDSEEEMIERARQLI